MKRRPDGAYDLSLDPDRREVVVDLLRQLGDLIESQPDHPNLARLRPPAYTDDPDADAAYQLLAGEELRTSRQEAIEAVIASLGRDQLTEDELWSWLQALNGVRLVVGTRLGITEDESDFAIEQAFKALDAYDQEMQAKGREILDEVIAQIQASLSRSGLPVLDRAWVVDAMIDPLLAYFREHPGFLQLWFAGRSATLTELGGLFDDSWAEKLWHFLIEHKLINATTPLFAVQLMFEVGDRLFDVAFQRSPTGDDDVIDEGRRMLTAYLTTYASKTR